MSAFHIDGPAVVSFSGGRTSGYMLRRAIDASDLGLAAGVLVRNERSRQGKVLHFTRDRVAIEWENGYAAAHTDAELQQASVVKVSPFDEAEDTDPGCVP